MDPLLDVCVREPIMDPLLDVCVRELAHGPTLTDLQLLFVGGCIPLSLFGQPSYNSSRDNRSWRSTLSLARQVTIVVGTLVVVEIIVVVGIIV